MNIGETYKFQIGEGNHIALVQIVDIEKTSEGEVEYYICRRINNGSIILAFKEDLKT